MTNHILNCQSPTRSPGLLNPTTFSPIRATLNEPEIMALAELPFADLDVVNDLDALEERLSLVSTRSTPTFTSPLSSRRSSYPQSPASPLKTTPPLKPEPQDKEKYEYLPGACLVGAVISLGCIVGATAYALYNLNSRSLSALSIKAVKASSILLGIYLILHPLSFPVWPVTLGIAIGIGGASLSIYWLGLFLGKALNQGQKYLATPKKRNYVPILTGIAQQLKITLAFSSAGWLLGFKLSSGVALSSLPWLLYMSTLLAAGGVSLLGLSIIYSLYEQRARSARALVHRSVGQQIVPCEK